MPDGVEQWPDLWFFPAQAAEAASGVDTLYSAMLWMTGILMVGIAGTILYFMVKYRRGTQADRDNPPTGSWTLEAIWVVIPGMVVVGIFVWSMILYTSLQAFPQSGLDVYVVGKQWMWKVQYPNGKREVNSLHVPVGETVRLQMTSQDVIHSFYVPAFRLKQDVLPGRFTTLSFKPTEPGTYHLFCAEYCGTDHSKMRGTVTVMKPSAYEQWMAGDGAAEAPGQSLADQGEQLYQQEGCASCHEPDTAVDAPQLTGLWQSEVELESGDVVTADRNYIRTSILQSQASIVAGYEPVMPSFQGQLSEDEVIALIAYIKSLAEQGASETSDDGAEQGPPNNPGSRDDE